MGGQGVQLRSAGRVIRLSGPGMAEVAPAVLGALDGRFTTTELAERLGFELHVVDAVVRPLMASGVVQDAAAWERPPVLAVARDHFAELGADPAEVQTALARARVGFVGLGPMARVAARHLAAAGVGEMVLVDDAVVGDHDDIVAGLAGASSGLRRRRADVATEECRAASDGAMRVSSRPTPRADDAEATGSLLADVDLLLVDAVDAEKLISVLNLACLRGDGRLLPWSVTFREAFVGPLVQERVIPCYLCAQTRRLSHLRHHDAHVAFRAAVDGGAITAPQVAVLSGHVSVVAGLLGLEVLRIVGGFAPAVTAGAVLVADFATLEVRREEILAVPGCPACGEAEVTLA